VIVTMVNPGFCHSELLRDAKGIAGTIMLFLNRILGFTAEEGSRQLVWAAVGGEPDKLRGEYISGCQTEEVADFVLSPQGVKAENQLWCVFALDERLACCLSVVFFAGMSWWIL
jgi:hypothetical protein